MFHPAGILFKGSGFYSTDSRRSASGKGKPGDKAGKSGDRAAESSSSTKTAEKSA